MIEDMIDQLKKNYRNLVDLYKVILQQLKESRRRSKQIAFLRKNKERTMAEELIDELKDNYTSVVSSYKAILQQLKEMNERLNAITNKITQ